MLSPSDHQRVRAALSQAEAATEGEIHCVVARQSGRYLETPLAWGAALALVGPPLALMTGVRPSAFIAAMLTVTQGGWSVDQAGAADTMATAAVIGYAALQAAVFALAVAVGLLPAARLWMTPSILKRRLVHARAMDQLAHQRHVSRAPAGVMIYASLAERRIEIVADEAAHQAIGAQTWDDVLKLALDPIRGGDMAAGLTAAILRCGEVLAQRFPRADRDGVPADDQDLTEI